MGKEVKSGYGKWKLKIWKLGTINVRSSQRMEWKLEEENCNGGLRYIKSRRNGKQSMTQYIEGGCITISAIP